MATEKKQSVAGEVGARTEGWKLLAEELGDRPADLVCAWADLCDDPAEALDGALSVLRLAGKDQDVAHALNMHMMDADVKAYLKAYAEHC